MRADPDCYIFRSSIICCDCAKKYMDKAMSEAQETKVCPACNAPGMVPLSDSPDMHKPPLSRYNTTGDELHCNACGLTECFESDHDADTDAWPQAVPDLSDPNEGGEYCGMCHTAIAEPSDEYKAKQALGLLPDMFDAIRRGERSTRDFSPLPDIIEALRTEWDDEELIAASMAACPESAELVAVPDPEEMLLTCICKCASMHTSPRAWLADGNLSRILERL